ncbi:hypothetical protein BE20_18980 [Sorangium cellulosum]|uniref:Uncharacterized protein n=1 Tax=Sorangium cellulosum TaxID=56 RepID=A0A150SC61_SORCE|nr:hypothetical protein BE20_18980 [Sorangium cellulosum]KYF93547.1 hypothetical protein BE18_40755 [Sorangium cellulosum]
MAERTADPTPPADPEIAGVALSAYAAVLAYVAEGLPLEQSLDHAAIPVAAWPQVEATWSERPRLVHEDAQAALGVELGGKADAVPQVLDDARPRRLRGGSGRRDRRDDLLPDAAAERVVGEQHARAVRAPDLAELAAAVPEILGLAVGARLAGAPVCVVVGIRGLLGAEQEPARPRLPGRARRLQRAPGVVLERLAPLRRARVEQHSVRIVAVTRDAPAHVVALDERASRVVQVKAIDERAPGGADPVAGRARHRIDLAPRVHARAHEDLPQQRSGEIALEIHTVAAVIDRRDVALLVVGVAGHVPRRQVARRAAVLGVVLVADRPAVLRLGGHAAERVVLDAHADHARRIVEGILDGAVVGRLDLDRAVRRLLGQDPAHAVVAERAERAVGVLHAREAAVLAVPGPRDTAVEGAVFAEPAGAVIA